MQSRSMISALPCVPRSVGAFKMAAGGAARGMVRQNVTKCRRGWNSWFAVEGKGAFPSSKAAEWRFCSKFHSTIGRSLSREIHTDVLPPGAEAGEENDDSGKGARPSYFDNQATTPVDPRVLDKMLPLFVDAFGNPHSRTHALGWEAEELVEEARRQVAKLVNASPKEIIFTSGATESNNMAIKGAAEFYGSQNPKKRHIITTQIEHKCVLASCRHLQSHGWDVTYLPVNQDGLVDLDEFEKSIRPGETLMASVMMVNNEIGVLQPIEELTKLCRKHKILFHTDAAQAVGKIPVDVNAMNIDIMSISGHKLYGPKGIGAIYIRGKPRVRLSAIISGGGQERGFRSGTLPAPIIVGLGEACRIAGEEMENDKRHITFLADRLYNGVMSQLPDVTLNGSKLHRYHGNLNLSFAFVEGESLLMSLPGVALSSGSACTSASLEPSYVLRAIGVDEELAHTSLRFGIGRFTSVEEVDKCVKLVVEHVSRLRDMSPLWEMSQDSEGPTSFVWT